MQEFWANSASERDIQITLLNPTQTGGTGADVYFAAYFESPSFVWPEIL